MRIDPPTLAAPGLPPADAPDDRLRRLATVFDGTRHFLALLSPDGALLEANRGSLELVGAAPDAVLGLPFWTTPWFHDAADGERVRTAVAAAAAGRPQTLVVRYPAPEQGWLDVELALTPVSKDGRVAAIVAEGHDVTPHRAAESALLASEQRLAGILGIAADAIVSVDEAQRICLFNHGAETTFGYRADEVLGQPLEMLLPESARPGHSDQVRAFGRGTETARFMNRTRSITGRRRNGELFPAEATISRLDVPGGPFYTAVLRDITERRRTENELERARRYTEAVLGSVAEGVFGLDRDGRLAFANPAALALLGYANGDVVGRDMHALIHHSHEDGSPYPAEACPVHASIHHGEVTRCEDDVYWRADGSPLPVEFTTTPFVIDGEVAGAVVVFRDISERKRHEAALRTLSQVDELTGLYNRRGFRARAEPALARAAQAGQPCLVVFIDLDGFKPINDVHGHLLGDLALQDVATLLRTVFRDGDILARFGGDEFVVLAVGSHGPDPLASIRNRLAVALAVHNASTTRPFALSLSVGAAPFDPRHPETLDALLDRADVALYAEKRQRKGQGPLRTPLPQ